MKRRAGTLAGTLLAGVVVLVAVALVAISVRSGNDKPRAATRSTATTATAGTTAPATATSVVTTTPGSTVPPAQKKVFDQIMAQVSEIRGLAWKGPLDLRVVSPEELARRVRDTNDRDFDPAQIAAQEQALKLFHLIPADADLRTLLDDLLSGLVVGFYDPRTKQLFVAGTDLDAPTRYTIAHEMTHALTDQWFDFGPATDALDKAGKTEESSAYSALLEGDAVLTQQRWADKYLSPEDAFAAALGGSSGGDLSAIAKTPPYLLASLTFPYDEGLTFVKTLFGAGGTKAVDAAYRKPPTSTEQIIHPQAYTGGQGALTPAVPDVAAATGCTSVYKGVIGEFDMRAVLSQRLSESDAGKAADGWNGDAMSVVKCGSVVGLADRWEADPGTDPADLAGAIGKWVGTWSGSGKSPGGDGRFSGPNGSGRVTRAGTHVDLVLAGDGATADKLERAFSG